MAQISFGKAYQLFVCVTPRIPAQEAYLVISELTEPKAWSRVGAQQKLLV